MWGRFHNNIDRKYRDMFKDDFTLGFYSVDNEKKFYTLIGRAIKRGSIATKEELIALVGEAIYDYAVENRHLVEGVDYL